MSKDSVKDVIRVLYKGWILHEQSWDTTHNVYSRNMDDCMTEAAGGDAIIGQLIALFGEWSNDVQSLTPYLGIALVRDHADKLVIREDIPPAPSADHYWWKDGEWFANDQQATKGETNA